MGTKEFKDAAEASEAAAYAAAWYAVDSAAAKAAARGAAKATAEFWRSSPEAARWRDWLTTC